MIIDLFVSEVKGNSEKDSMILLKTSSSFKWPVRGFKLKSWRTVCGLA